MANERHEFLQDDGQLRVFIVPVDILDVPDLSSSEKLVYIVLRSYVNPTDPTAFPSYETIAKKASLSRRRVIDIVKSLEEKGLIKKEIRLAVTKDRKIKNTSNLYTLVTPKKKTASEIISLGGVKSFHRGSEMISPEHNHLKEPLLNMIDCMGSHDEIYKTLKNQVPKNCYANSIPLGAGYIDEIYTMLLNQFPKNLEPEIVIMACEIYFNRACELDLMNAVVMTIDIKNPIGFFQNCYKDACEIYKVNKKK